MSTEAAAVDSAGGPVVKKKTKRKKKLSFPTAFTILFVLTIIAVIATSFVPAGQYAKLQYVADSNVLTVTSPQGEISEVPATQDELDQLGVQIDIEQFTGGSITKAISIPGTYEQLQAQPKGIADVTQAMVSGTIDGVDIMVFILVLGGLIGVVNATGAFESGLMALTKKTKGHEFLLVFMVALLMVLGGTSCGLEEEAVAFYPILVPVFLALGYDSIVCVGAIFLAGSMGTTFSTINPFSVVIASNAAGINFMEGFEWRVGGCIVGAIVVISYLYWYCKKIKANPEASYTYEDREHFAQLFNVERGETAAAHAEGFSLRKKAILVLFISAFVLMVYGVMNLHWWFPQMAAMFLAISIIIMFISGTDEKTVVNAFINGASSLVGVFLDHRPGPWHQPDHGRGPDLRHAPVLVLQRGPGHGGPGVHPDHDAAVLPARLRGPVFLRSGRFGNAHYGSPGRYGRHRSLLHRLRLSVGSVRDALPRTYRPGFGNPDHVGYEVLQVVQVRVAHRGVHVGVRRYPPVRAGHARIMPQTYSL